MKNKKSRKRLRIILLAVFLGCAAAFGFWFFMNGSPIQGTVWFSADAEVRPMASTYSFTGTVEARNRQEIVSSAGGIVREVYIWEDGNVRKGDRLIRMDNSEILKSDIDGEVVELSVQSGDYIQPGTCAAVITDMSKLEVLVDIDEYDISSVVSGAPVQVTIPALDKTFSGTIRRVSRNGRADAQMTVYSASVLLDNPPDNVYPGMQAEVEFVREKVENAVTIPKKAIQFRDDDTAFVYFCNPETKDYEEHDITTGIVEGNRVQITSGVEAGDTVYWKGDNPFVQALMSISTGSLPVAGGAE